MSEVPQRKRKILCHILKVYRQMPKPSLGTSASQRKHIKDQQDHHRLKIKIISFSPDHESPNSNLKTLKEFAVFICYYIYIKFEINFEFKICI